MPKFRQSVEKKGKKLRIVLDTNIIVSAFINPNGNPSKIVKLILQRQANLYINPGILHEYKEVMLRPKFSSKFDSGLVPRFIDLLRAIGTPFEPLPSKNILPDESDRIFYDTAKQSGSFLVSGNLKHYPKEPFIMQPVDFLEMVSV